MDETWITGSNHERFEEVLFNIKKILSENNIYKSKCLLIGEDGVSGNTQKIETPKDKSEAVVNNVNNGGTDCSNDLDNSVINKKSIDDVNGGDNALHNEPLLSKLEINIRDLLAIVEEFELLKTKYRDLEKSVEQAFSNKTKERQTFEEKQKYFNINVDSLKKENSRLTSEMKELTLKTEADLESQIAREKELASRIVYKEREVAQKDKDLKTQVQLNEVLERTVSRLEKEITEHKKATNEAVEKLAAHDAAAKRAITVIQKEMNAKLEKVTKEKQEALGDKDAYVIKVLKLEALLDELQKDSGQQNKKSTEQTVELGRVKALLQNKEIAHGKVTVANESLEKEIAKLKENAKKHKEELEAYETKAKWSQNKLKAELESHKETKKQITQLNNKLKEAKEEGNQIRKNCQEMIERYQGDEEIKSVRLDKQILEYQNQTKVLEEKFQKLQQTIEGKDTEINRLKEEKSKIEKEFDSCKLILKKSEEKNKQVNTMFDEQVKDNAEVKTKMDSLKEELKELQECKATIKEYESETCALKETVESYESQIAELNQDIKEQKDKHDEVLSYSRSLTENVVDSKSMVTDLQQKLDRMIQEKEEMKILLDSRENESQNKINKLEEQKKKLQINVDELTDSLDRKTKSFNELTSTLDESNNQLAVLKKKNNAQVKDLQKQLQQTSRKIEKLESTSNGSCENLSNRSRTSSCNSLEKIHPNGSPKSSSPKLHHEPPVAAIQQDHYITQPNRNSNSFPEVEVDKKVLVDRICKLQRSLAKYTEKMEFMQEHVSQLTEDVQKKSKIIQFYMSREEPGTLASNKYDRNKADVSQHGGIMASVYSAKPTDKAMTLDLSLSINQQLQAVLEDTILKNIMLKENINTLGDEIARLQEQISKQRT